ncbi:hypothetical protein BN85401010 [Alteracholeplasma palmae J233]|uniref:Uncharacterized protein n=1 Tax=Alteracholeplasma palmae (strain ATCC 49389 / J233) TaxID=1318466 RepID=U4KJS5_ALTPJ|nr:hypothetical protein [Alteracholeplasma palmae]CCV63678.1 hypothetical protein BN85401010 [Alteracholeplasma palmae J233]
MKEFITLDSYKFFFCVIKKNFKYYYDDLNRLIREDNKLLNRTQIHEYDTNDNITSKKVYSYSTDTPVDLIKEYAYNYSKDDKDQLDMYQDELIEYETIGKPSNYRGNKITYLNNDIKSYNDISFTYNKDHIRISKIALENKIEYILDGNKILKEKISEMSSHFISDDIYIPEEYVNEVNSYEKTYIYGITGITGFKIKKSNQIERYYYHKNIMGDIIEILDRKQKVIGKYVYDGRYYDPETGKL